MDDTRSGSESVAAARAVMLPEQRNPALLVAGMITWFVVITLHFLLVAGLAHAVGDQTRQPNNRSSNNLSLCFVAVGLPCYSSNGRPLLHSL